MSALVNPGLAAQLERADEFNADACMNCGVCSAICPHGRRRRSRASCSATCCSAWRIRSRDETEHVFSCLLCRCARRTARRACTSPRTCARCATTSSAPSSASRRDDHASSDRRRHRHPGRQPAPAQVGAAAPRPRSPPAGPQGLDLPRGGETVLYTGMMYQLIPYIEGLVRAEQRLGDSCLAELDRPGPRASTASSTCRPSWRGPQRRSAPCYDQVPINVVHLLRRGRSRVRRPVRGRPLLRAPWPTTSASTRSSPSMPLACRPPYASTACETVITIDPHTTNMLRSVYPEVLHGYDVEVRSYLEVLAEKRPRRRHAGGRPARS